MIIITGGAGFIGSALVWRFNQLGFDDILVVDHLGKSRKWENLRALRFADYIEKDKFRELINSASFGNEKIDAIFHFGACSSTTELDASYLIDNNFNYSKELAKFCFERSVRFIYASSAATYGDGSRGWLDDENSIERLIPLNMYGYSKQIFDIWMKKNGMLKNSTALKFTNVFGPNEWHKGDMRSVVCKAYEQISRTGKMQLFKSHRDGYADGEQKRDFLYVKDAVEMVMYIYKNNLAGIFNIGSGRAETWNSLAEAIFLAMGIEKNIEYIDMPCEIRDKYQYYSCADMNKLYASGYDKEPATLKSAVKNYIVEHLTASRHLGE